MRIEEAVRASAIVALLFVFALALPTNAQQLPASGPFSHASIANGVQEVQADLPKAQAARPVVIYSGKPFYTPEAMRHKIQGVVVVEADVKTDGTVGDVKVVKSLDKTYGLDDAAVKAAKRWRFKPVIKDGKAVPVTVTIEMAFSLADPKPARSKDE